MAHLDSEMMCIHPISEFIYNIDFIPRCQKSYLRQHQFFFNVLVILRYNFYFTVDINNYSIILHFGFSVKSVTNKCYKKCSIRDSKRDTDV